MPYAWGSTSHPPEGSDYQILFPQDGKGAKYPGGEC